MTEHDTYAREAFIEYTAHLANVAKTFVDHANEHGASDAWLRYGAEMCLMRWKLAEAYARLSPSDRKDADFGAL